MSDKSIEVEKLFELRKEKVTEVCKKYKMNTGKPLSNIFDSILCFSKYQFCYCPNSKTGTTTWMNHFLTKTGLPEILQNKWQDKPGAFGKDRSLHYHVRKLYLLPNFLSDKEKREYLNSYKMVTYGRHPFVRLVSTYKDKVIDHKIGLGLRWKIMMKFDKNHPYSAFPTFIKNIVNRTIAEDWHVNRYWERCDLCHLNYEIIGKMETFANDTKYVMSKIGMNDQDFEHHEHKSVGDSTRDLALELFAKLPKKLKKQLYELYKVDFEMFEYDATPFM